MPNFRYKNYESHTVQRNYLVFYFYAKDNADYFESLLIAHEIPYERGLAKNLVRRHLVGVHKSHREKAEELNDETGNMFRKPFLSDNITRYFVLILTLIVVILALVGYLKAR